MAYKRITTKFIKILILILLILLILILIFYLINKKIKSTETFNNYKKIPLNIYQTWHTKELPPNLLKYNNILKKNNPEFTFYLYDENECREFIKKHFNKNVLDAYDKLIPYAYKADLWRYCILYINGGIYLDIKYYTINNFKLLTLTDKEYFVKDRPAERQAIYNALIVSAAGNKILLDCITPFSLKNGTVI
jgi:mannosyltransferase OCH1-like enzyme